jgi:hypothetical protein
MRSARSEVARSKGLANPHVRPADAARKCTTYGATLLEPCSKSTMTLNLFPMVRLLVQKCHLKVVEDPASGGGEQKGGWDDDGWNGPDDPKTSIHILIDWWMAEGNYSRYCSKNNLGVKKKQFCHQLAMKMTSKTKSERTSKNVLNKIQHIKKTFKEAPHQFATSETGAGIKCELACYEARMGRERDVMVPDRCRHTKE